MTGDQLLAFLMFHNWLAAVLLVPRLSSTSTGVQRCFKVIHTLILCGQPVTTPHAELLVGAIAFGPASKLASSGPCYYQGPP